MEPLAQQAAREREVHPTVVPLLEPGDHLAGILELGRPHCADRLLDRRTGLAFAELRRQEGLEDPDLGRFLLGLVEPCLALAARNLLGPLGDHLPQECFDLRIAHALARARGARAVVALADRREHQSQRCRGLLVGPLGGGLERGLQPFSEHLDHSVLEPRSAALLDDRPQADRTPGVCPNGDADVPRRAPSSGSSRVNPASDQRTATAALALQDGTVFLGSGIGAPGVHVGELVFNTAMTGYQEILTDPSYAGQIVTFTFPHIGNVGANAEDVEATTPVARGLVLRAPVTSPSNWRAERHLVRWLEGNGIAGITGVDTRRITRILREKGAQNAALAYAPDGRLDLHDLVERASSWPGLVGMDLVPEVTSRQRAIWREGRWEWGRGYVAGTPGGPPVVAIDYGIKRNILRSLVSVGLEVTVVPATTSASEILALKPAGVVLSNGPGDPAATGAYAVPVIRELLAAGLPIMGICLGHQMLGLAVGARTEKMRFGHHGANHPVKDLTTGKVEITSQNHGFAIADEGLPEGVEVTHRSLFDGTIQGIRLVGRPVFSVQYHPEASPGPQDSHYLFHRFRALVERAAA